MLLTLDPTLRPYQLEAHTPDQLLDSFEERGWRGTYPNTEDIRNLRAHRAAHTLPPQCHRGYVAYLESCWQAHRGAVLSPDALWQLLLGEVAALVKEDPERFRHLYSETQEKQTIVVPGLPELPEEWLPEIMHHLRQLVPTDVDRYCPRFTTTNDAAWLARQAMFADIVSPYYDYCVCACGIPRLEVTGTLQDWQTVLSNWVALGGDLAPPGSGEHSWFERVWKRLTQLVEELELLMDPNSGVTNVDFFRDFFKLERCGSGSEVEVGGWILDLYRKKIPLTKPENCPGGLATVDFTFLFPGGRIPYRLISGVLGGQDRDDGIREPVWGWCLLERLEQPEVLPRQPRGSRVTTFALPAPDPDAPAAVSLPFGELPTEKFITAATFKGRRLQYMPPVVEVPGAVMGHTAGLEKVDFQ